MVNLGLYDAHLGPIEFGHPVEVFTPDDLMSGIRPAGKRVVIFDDDHYYLASSMAELLVKDGDAVVYVTPEPEVATWTHKTMEQHRIQARLLHLGVRIVTAHGADRIASDGLVARCEYTEREQLIESDAVVLVTSRLPNEDLYLDLLDHREQWESAGLVSVRAVGDAFSPGSIAAAVWDGRRFAEELGRSDETAHFRRNIAAL